MSCDYIPIYTRKGDTGTSQIRSVPDLKKSAPAFAAIGAIEELCAILGECRIFVGGSSEDAAYLRDIQEALFEVGADLSGYVLVSSKKFEARVTAMETRIDATAHTLPPLKNFIIPFKSAKIHVARTVCRRAERCIVRHDTATSPSVLAFMNRLSDYLFILARKYDTDDKWHLRRIHRASGTHAACLVRAFRQIKKCCMTAWGAFKGMSMWSTRGRFVSGSSL